MNFDVRGALIAVLICAAIAGGAFGILATMIIEAIF